MKKMMEQVMEDILRSNAQADLILSTAKSLRMTAQNGAINEYKVSSSQILGIRVIKDHRVGISYTESFDSSSLKLMLKQAFDNAQMSEPNPHEKILNLTGELRDEMTYAESDTDLSIKTQKTLELESKVKSMDSRVIAVPHNGYSESEYQSQYLNSSGRFTSQGDKSYSITSSALLDDRGKKGNFYDYHMAHTFKDLQWDRVVETALYHARELLNEASLPTGKYQVQFTEDCLESLIGCFSNFYSAKAAMDKMNPWADKLGESVISKDLTVEDHPSYEHAFRASLFDDEGVERKRMNLIENGVLQSFYHNSVTASYFNGVTTGHAARGAASSLGVGGTHVLIHGKNKKSMPSRYLEIIQMDGLHSGANRVTGNFSFGIKGYVWDRGQRVGTFGNITLSGNIVELLKNVEVVGDQLRASRSSSFFSVPLIFNDLSIAGS